MNTSTRKLTLQQERIAYTRVVIKTLSTFFEKTPTEAAELVNAWWERMGYGDVFRTGLFMHDEPINTAANLAGTGKAPAIRDLGERYEQIIKDSLPKPRAAGRKRPRNQTRTARAA